MSTYDLGQHPLDDLDHRWPTEQPMVAAWHEADRDDSPLVIEDLDHPAPVTAAYTFCG